MNAGRFAERLRAVGHAKAMKARMRRVRDVVAVLRRDGLNAETRGGDARVTLPRGRFDDGRLRWLALWLRERVR